jgi:hypothetical protein
MDRKIQKNIFKVLFRGATFCKERNYSLIWLFNRLTKAEINPTKGVESVSKVVWREKQICRIQTSIHYFLPAPA